MEPTSKNTRPAILNGETKNAHPEFIRGCEYAQRQYVKDLDMAVEALESMLRAIRMMIFSSILKTLTLCAAAMVIVLHYKGLLWIKWAWAVMFGSWVLEIVFLIKRYRKLRSQKRDVVV